MGGNYELCAPHTQYNIFTHPRQLEFDLVRRGTAKLTILPTRWIDDEHERLVHLVSGSHSGPSIRHWSGDLHEEVGIAIVRRGRNGDAVIL